MVHLEDRHRADSRACRAHRDYPEYTSYRRYFVQPRRRQPDSSYILQSKSTCTMAICQAGTEFSRTKWKNSRSESWRRNLGFSCEHFILNYSDIPQISSRCFRASVREHPSVGETN